MGVLDLPRVTPHGFGIPQILSAWDEKQKDIKAEGLAAAKAKQDKELFDLNKKNIESQISERESLRQDKALTNIMSMISTSEKLMKDPKTFEAGLAMSNMAYGNMNKVFPDLKLDVSGVSDAAERRKTAGEQVTEKLYNLYESASTSQDPKLVSQLKKHANQALNNGFINEDTAKFFMDVKPKEADKDKYISVAPGNIIIDPATGKQIFSNQKPEKQGGAEWAPDVKPYYNPDTNKSISVNVRDPNAIEMAKQLGFTPMTEQQKGYLSKTGELGAKAEEEYSSEITKARGTINTLTSMDQLLDRFESGKLAGWEKTIQQYADAFGVSVDTKNLTSKEAFTALSEQLALQSRNLGPGQVLAGQMSDKDVQFLRDMNPQLLITKGGNKLIIKMRIEIAKRNQEIAKLIPEFKKQNNGVFDRAEFEQYVDSKMKKKSIFGIPDDAEFIGMDKETGLPAYATPESKARGSAFVPSF